jgi:hypothetical protein
MSIMTRLPGVSDRDDVRPGMAHFAGTGPVDTTCGGCEHRGYWRAAKGKFNKQSGLIEERRVRVQGCKMFLVLTHRHGPPVRKEWPACKHYVEHHPVKGT